LLTDAQLLSQDLKDEAEEDTKEKLRDEAAHFSFS
jgi:hypothetical protein